MTPMTLIIKSSRIVKQLPLISSCMLPSFSICVVMLPNNLVKLPYQSFQNDFFIYSTSVEFTLLLGWIDSVCFFVLKFHNRDVFFFSFSFCLLLLSIQCLWLIYTKFIQSFCKYTKGLERISLQIDRMDVHENNFLSSMYSR